MLDNPGTALKEWLYEFASWEATGQIFWLVSILVSFSSYVLSWSCRDFSSVALLLGRNHLQNRWDAFSFHHRASYQNHAGILLHWPCWFERNHLQEQRENGSMSMLDIFSLVGGTEKPVFASPACNAGFILTWCGDTYAVTLNRKHLNGQTATLDVCTTKMPCSCMSCVQDSGSVPSSNTC